MKYERLNKIGVLTVFLFCLHLIPCRAEQEASSRKINPDLNGDVNKIQTTPDGNFKDFRRLDEFGAIASNPAY